MKMEQPRRRPVVAILGGGLSGAATAFHLARTLPPQSADIVVVEPRESLGRGLAYSTTDPAHRINVPASKMTLISSDLGHFMAWLAAERRALSPGTLTLRGDFFPERQIFGQYVGACLEPYLASGAIRHLRATAVSAERLDERLPGRPLGRDLARSRPRGARHDPPDAVAARRAARHRRFAAADRQSLRQPADRRDRPDRAGADRRHRPHLGRRRGEPLPPRLLGRDRRAVAPRAALARPRRRRAQERGGLRPASGAHRPRPRPPHPFGGRRRRRLRAQLARHPRPGARAGPGRLARALDPASARGWSGTSAPSGTCTASASRPRSRRCSTPQVARGKLTYHAARLVRATEAEDGIVRRISPPRRDRHRAATGSTAWW